MPGFEILMLLKEMTSGTVTCARSHVIDQVLFPILLIPSAACFPAIIRSLNQPFDFITWFEYAESDSDAFEELVLSQRQTPEWGYVE